ncbi:theronine dehydrogenase-like Zn-dependent dehydrogenase [Actinoplanes friuliensis DSM 7358]|uniref:Theronine dehydrogenase-like Zn-dependent dehydrogenase n=2 Tax=Actinoplanes friuliensis TaxID=196914 RepID=U5W3U4_9ACTN|nr:theronine dehydrogenase-like Zn-dependent dehydrogenase [Actinoplanes friuliensis DSM 7358]
MWHAPRDVRWEERPDPVVQLPTDAVVRVVAACVCGSDLWTYRGARPPADPHPIGHEFVGVVEEIGAGVTTVKEGDFVVSPFSISDGTCVHCRQGITTSCVQAQWYGGTDPDGRTLDGGQGRYVRVPLADGTLVATPGLPDTKQIPALLALSDVLVTGHHAAVSAGVGPGRTVAVVGDGAVGLCAVLAAVRLGAERVIAFSSHTDRQEVATGFGASDIISERGDEGAAALRDLLGDLGADAVLECVGTSESMAQALASVRPGGAVGYVGVPLGGAELPIKQMFGANIRVAGGVAPVRPYLPELLAEVLAGTLDASAVFDLQLPMDRVAEAYAAMDERRSIKTLLWP